MQEILLFLQDPTSLLYGIPPSNEGKVLEYIWHEASPSGGFISPVMQQYSDRNDIINI